MGTLEATKTRRRKDYIKQGVEVPRYLMIQEDWDKISEKRKKEFLEELDSGIFNIQYSEFGGFMHYLATDEGFNPLELLYVWEKPYKYKEEANRYWDERIYPENYKLEDD